MTMTKDEFMKYCEEVAELVEKKHQDYQGSIFNLQDYFPFGEISYAQMLWVKVVRIASLSKAREDGNESMPNYESLKDSVDDLIAYSVFFKDYLTPTNPVINIRIKESK